MKTISKVLNYFDSNFYCINLEYMDVKIIEFEYTKKYSNMSTIREQTL